VKIRSITCFARLEDVPGTVQAASRLLAAAREAVHAAGFQVQTTRLALGPLREGFAVAGAGAAKPASGAELVALALELQQRATAAGIEYVTLGPAQPDDPEELWDAVPAVLAATQSIFAAGSFADANTGLSLAAARRAARIIHANARAGADGFVNLRFAALANVGPGVPFLPAAYHGGDDMSFAYATESADLAVEAFAGASTLSQARAELLQRVERDAAALLAAAETTTARTGVRFGGIDFSMAPFPEQARSLAHALESLGLPALGHAGSVAAAAFLTDTLDRARVPRTGFSGLFLPVLEDDVLARRSAEGLLGINDLLLLSGVCGTGLDTVPLPGDITVDELTAILLDVGALSLRLDKPLTARLMPLPGKRAGDPAEFDFPYFAPGKVMAHRARALSGALAGTGPLPLAPIRPRRSPREPSS
jgi:uncharacterized protein (UPF0210 family)